MGEKYAAAANSGRAKDTETGQQSRHGKWTRIYIWRAFMSQKMDGIEYVVMPQIMDGGKAELIGGFYRRDLTCVRLGN